jgi:Fe-S-cluster containining protein
MCYGQPVPAPNPSFSQSSHRAELLALYAEVDGLLAPFSCDASAECCHFGTTGREPYPTAIELAEVERAVRAGSLLARSNKDAGGSKKRKLPLASWRCPLLSSEGRCRIYAARPFGCRTYFCERMSGPGKLPRAEIQAVSRRIADLAARFAPRDPLPRPLTKALGSAG